MNQKAGEKFRPWKDQCTFAWDALGQHSSLFFRLKLMHKYMNVTLWSDSLERNQFTCHHTTD